MLDVIIIGGGPAGLTAALYTARAKLETLVIEKAFYGGQMALTNEIENYPGFESVSGSVLADKMVEHAEKFGARFIKDEVLELNLDGPVKKVRTHETTYETKTVILAMGASPKELGLKNEKMLIGSGVSYCATCDGAFFKNKDVAVIGGGNTAADDALYLSRFCNKVVLVHRRDTMRAAKVLQESILSNERIVPYWDSVVEEIIGDFKVEGMKVRNLKTNAITEVPVSGIFVAVGNIPNTDLVKGKVDMNQYGYILTDETLSTNIKGVFAAGDLREKHLRQIVTAASDGADAAFWAEKYISENKL